MFLCNKKKSSILKTLHLTCSAGSMLLLNAPLKKFSYKLLFYLCERLTSTHLFFVMLYLACREDEVRFGGGEG